MFRHLRLVIMDPSALILSTRVKYANPAQMLDQIAAEKLLTGKVMNVQTQRFQ